MRVRRVLVYALLLAAALLYFTPFLWTVSTSLKSLPETVGFDLFPDNPEPPCLSRGADGLQLRPLRPQLGLPRRDDHRRQRLPRLARRLCVRPPALPGPGVAVPRRAGDADDPGSAAARPVFQMLTNWHLVGTFQGFIAINLVLAANLFLMRQYFLTIPKDFEEAAKLDGAGYFKTYWRVMLPLATPALAAVTILTFQGMWNEFFWSLIILGFGDPDRYTLQLGHRSVPLPVPDALAAADGRERDRDPADRAHLRRLPALLHLRRRLERRQGMTVSVSTSLRGALRDFYEHSWRLVALNAALSVCVLAILAAASFWAPALLLLLLLGPLAAAMMHCAVSLVREGELSLRDAAAGLAPALAPRARPRRTVRRGRPRRPARRPRLRRRVDVHVAARVRARVPARALLRLPARALAAGGRGARGTAPSGARRRAADALRPPAAPRSRSALLLLLVNALGARPRSCRCSPSPSPTRSSPPRASRCPPQPLAEA